MKYNLKKSTFRAGSDLPSNIDLYDTKYLENTALYKPMNYNFVDDRATNFALSDSYLGGNKQFSKKEENNLKKLFYELINKSYLNYLNHKTKRGGVLIDSLASEQQSNHSVINSHNAPNMLSDSLNTTNLSYDVKFNIEPVNSGHPEFSSFAKDH